VGDRNVVCTWAQDERPAELHMAQPNVPVSKTGFLPARLVRGGCPDFLLTAAQNMEMVYFVTRVPQFLC
jgi:hypothetical protein